MMTFGNKSLTCANRTASSSNADHDIEGKEGQLMLDALNGFLIYVNMKCSVKFVSTTIKDHLGLAQENLIGKSVLDIVHVSDQNELVKQFNKNKGAKQYVDRCTETVLDEDEPQRVFYVRMKYNLPKPGSKTKHTGYMLVQWTGKMKKHVSSNTGTIVVDGLLCICRPMQTTSLLEIRMDGNMFMSRHDLGMTFTFCDTRIITLIGYEPNEVVGKTAYHFHNPIDAPKVKACHQNLIVKGASISKYYRFIGKNNNWVWLQTRATIIYNTANKAQYIVCMNYVISEEEGEKFLMLEEHQQANSHTGNTILTLPDNIHHPQTTSTVCTPGPHIVELDEENLEKTACLNGELNEPHNVVAINGQFGQLSGTDYNFESRIMGQLSSNAIEYQSFGNSQQISMCSQQPTPQHSENSSFVDPLVCASSSASGAVIYSDSPCPSSVETYIASPLEDHLKDGYAQGAAESSSSHSVVDDAGYISATSPYLSSTYFSPATVSPACSSDSASIEHGYFSDSSSGPQGLLKGECINFGLGYSAPAGVTNPNLLQEDNSMDDGNAELINAETILDQLLWSFSQQQNSQDSFDMNMAAVFSTIESLTNHSLPVLSSNATSMRAESTITNVLQVLPAVTSPTLDTISKPTMNTVDKQSVKKIDKPLLRSFLTMPEDDIPKQPLGFLQSCSNNPSKTVTKDTKSLSKFSSVRQIDLSAERFLNQQNSTYNQKSFESSSTDTISDQPANSSASVDESLDLCEMPEDISEFALQYLDNVTDAQSKAIMAELQNNTFMDTSEIDLTNYFLNTLKTENVISPIFNQSTSSDLNSANGVMFSPSHLDGQNCSNTLGKFDQTNSHMLNLDWNNDISILTVNGKCGSPVTSSRDHLYHQPVDKLNGQNKSQPQKVTEYLGSCPVKLGGVMSSAFYDSQTQTPMKTMSLLECHLRNGMEEARKISKDMCNSSKPFLQQLLTGELTNDMYIRMESDRLYKDNDILPK